MKWETRLDDPIPALVIEAIARTTNKDSTPCSICRDNAKLIKKGASRTHFHVSDGGACKRRVLYSMREPLKARGFSSAAFLADGHLHERDVLERMGEGLNLMMIADPELQQDVGQMMVIAASNQEELQAKIPYTSDNEMNQLLLVGHWDGMMVIARDEGDEVRLLECKAVKKPKYDKVRGGYMDKEWYGQMQFYMKMLSDHLKKLEVKSGYLLVKNRETSQSLPPIRVDFDSNYLKKRRDALIEVHTALTKTGGMVNREHKNRKNDECKWCRFAEQCWGVDEMEATQPTTRRPKTTNQRPNNKLKGDIYAEKIEEDSMPILRRTKGKSRVRPSRKGQTSD